MGTEVAVALIGAAGLVLVALIGVLVELVRTRRRADVTVAELQPNHGTSMRDAVNRIERKVGQLAAEQRTQGDRLIVVETRLTDHLANGGQQ